MSKKKSKGDSKPLNNRRFYIKVDLPLYKDYSVEDIMKLIRIQVLSGEFELDKVEPIFADE